MEHGKKMVLIPQDFLSKLNNKKEEIHKPVEHMDTDMESLLQNSHMDDREKWVKYQQMLQRYLRFKEQERKPFKINIEESETQSLVNKEIIDAMPKMCKKRAELLLNRLISSNEIAWDNQGVVTIKGEKLGGTNITDLISDVIRARKTSNPLGWHQFTAFLKDINIPRDFIGNPRRLAYMDRGVVITPPMRSVDCIKTFSTDKNHQGDAVSEIYTNQKAGINTDIEQ